MDNKIKKIVGWTIIIITIIISFIFYKDGGTASLIGYLVTPAVLGYIFSRTKKGTATGFLIGSITFMIVSFILVFSY